MRPISLVAWLSFLLLTCAKTVVVTVGGNTTTNPSAVFQPQSVEADLDDVVLFNFTQGNHTVTQSTFSSPCTPAHITNSTANGFDSSFRNAGNYSAITQLTYTVTNPNITIWYFDWNLCAKGGVGAINVNESSYETIAGFTRNAIRLNGTSSVSSSKTPISTSASSSATDTSNKSSAAKPSIVRGCFFVTSALGLLVLIIL